eukprot:1309384-Karenia_brevis.AAC.1
MVVCSDCAPNHNKTCPRSRNDRDSTQGKLTISYPDSRNEMLWCWSKPWLERCDDESYRVANTDEFTIVLVPYV